MRRRAAHNSVQAILPCRRRSTGQHRLHANRYKQIKDDEKRNNRFNNEQRL
jgi:hypothetical protein